MGDSLVAVPQSNHIYKRAPLEWVQNRVNSCILMPCCLHGKRSNRLYCYCISTAAFCIASVGIRSKMCCLIVPAHLHCTRLNSFYWYWMLPLWGYNAVNYSFFHNATASKLEKHQVIWYFKFMPNTDKCFQVVFLVWTWLQGSDPCERCQYPSNLCLAQGYQHHSKKCGSQSRLG